MRLPRSCALVNSASEKDSNDAAVTAETSVEIA